MSVAGTDPIADLLTRIRNALAVNKHAISVPHSQLKEQIVKLLKKQGFISDFQVSKEGFKSLNITLANDETPSKITGLARISKPGRRVYVAAQEIPVIMGGHGLVVVSTSKGLLDGATARKQHLGGELMCKVW